MVEVECFAVNIVVVSIQIAVIKVNIRRETVL